MAEIVKFPLNVLDIDGYTLTDDEKDRIILTLQGKALRNPVQESIDSMRVQIAQSLIDIATYTQFSPSDISQATTKLNQLSTEVTNLEDHTNIVSGVAINYTGFPPNFLGRLSIASAYNKTKEALRKTSDGPCGVEESKSEIFSEIFRSILGHAETELENQISYLSGITVSTIQYTDYAVHLDTFKANLPDFKVQDTEAFFKAYNFVNRIAIAQAVVGLQTDDFTHELFDKVVGTQIFNTDDISALKVQCQVWGDDTTAPPSDFIGNFNSEFILSSVFDLLDINIEGWTAGQVLKFTTTGSLAPSDDLVGTGGGGSDFVSLTDTPGSINANEFVRGNAGGTDLEFGTVTVGDLPSTVLINGNTYRVELGTVQYDSSVLQIGNFLVGRHGMYSEATTAKQFIIPDLEGYPVISATSGIGCSEGMGYFVGATGLAEHRFVTSGDIGDIASVGVSGDYDDLINTPITSAIGELRCSINGGGAIIVGTTVGTMIEEDFDMTAVSLYADQAGSITAAIKRDRSGIITMGTVGLTSEQSNRTLDLSGFISTGFAAGDILLVAWEDGTTVETVSMTIKREITL